MTEDQITKECEELYDMIMTFLTNDIYTQFAFDRNDCEKIAEYACDLLLVKLEEQRCSESFAH